MGIRSERIGIDLDDKTPRRSAASHKRPKTKGEAIALLKQKLGHPIGPKTLMQLETDEYIGELCDSSFNDDQFEETLEGALKAARNYEREFSERKERPSRTSDGDYPDERNLFLAVVTAPSVARHHLVQAFWYQSGGPFEEDAAREWLETQIAEERQQTRERREADGIQIKEEFLPHFVEHKRIPLNYGSHPKVLELRTESGGLKTYKLTKFSGMLNFLNYASNVISFGLHWPKCDATWFLLTAKVPDFPKVRSGFHGTRGQLEGHVVMVIDPEASAAEVANEYRAIQDKVRKGSRYRPLEPRSSELLWLAWENPSPWKELLEIWNGWCDDPENRLFEPDWRFKDQRQMAKAYGQAFGDIKPRIDWDAAEEVPIGPLWASWEK